MTWRELTCLWLWNVTRFIWIRTEWKAARELHYGNCSNRMKVITESRLISLGLLKKSWALKIQISAAHPSFLTPSDIPSSYLLPSWAKASYYPMLTPAHPTGSTQLNLPHLIWLLALQLSLLHPFSLPVSYALPNPYLTPPMAAAWLGLLPCGAQW